MGTFFGVVFIALAKKQIGKPQIDTDLLRAYPKTFNISHEEGRTSINHADLLDANASHEEM